MRLDDNGNVGIGTTSPGYQLDIYKDSDSNYYAARFNSVAYQEPATQARRIYDLS